MSLARFVGKSLAALALLASFNAMADDLVLPGLDPKTPCARPDYPRASLANEEQGTTVVSVLVGTDGTVTDSKIEKSSGFHNLDKATLKLAQCKFKPVLNNGKAEATWVSLEYVWKLD
jgi:protein TonB